MKVIETPNIDIWKYECSCSTCKSKLEADADDLRFKIVKNYYGGDGDMDIDSVGSYQDDDAYYVICPLCNRELSVRIMDIPFLLTEKVKKKYPQGSKK